MASLAKVNFARYSPRKVGQVLDLIRRKPVKEAFKILTFTRKSSKDLVEDVLKSAVANSGRLKKQDGLYVKECYVNNGPVLKRFRAYAFGRAAGYRRKTCHLTIIVDDKKSGKGA